MYMKPTSVSHSSLLISVGLGCWSITFFIESTKYPCHNEQSRKRSNTRTKKHPNSDDRKLTSVGILLITFRVGVTRGETKSKACTPTPTPKRRNTPTEMILDYSMWITLLQTQNFLTCPPCFTLWRQQSSIQDDYQRQKSDNETCVPYPQSCAWLIGRINLDPNVLMPRTNLPTSWRKAISPVMEIIIFCVWSTSWTFHSLHPVISTQPAPLRPCRKD